jgi:hypothetical protein
MGQVTSTLPSRLRVMKSADEIKLRFDRITKYMYIRVFQIIIHNANRFDISTHSFTPGLRTNTSYL